MPLSFALAKARVPVQFQLGEEIQLTGYDVERGAQSIRARPYWCALRQPAPDCTRFAHVGDANEVLLAQQDSQPQAGNFPTSLWRAGDVVVDEVTLPLDASAQGKSLHL